MKTETVSFASTVVNSSALTWLLKLMFFLNLSWISNYQVLQYSMSLLWIAKLFVIVGWYFLKRSVQLLHLQPLYSMLVLVFWFCFWVFLCVFFGGGGLLFCGVIVGGFLFVWVPPPLFFFPWRTGMPQQISWRVSQNVRRIQSGLIWKWPLWCLIK